MLATFKHMSRAVLALLATLAATTAASSAHSKHAFINGNHAVYVEPPADFQPIIYGRATTKPPAAPLASSGAEAEVSGNQLAESPPLVYDDAGANSLKPPVGRWNDWRDMSDEPDSASSDALESRALPAWRFSSRCSPAQAAVGVPRSRERLSASSANSRHSLAAARQKPRFVVRKLAKSRAAAKPNKWASKQRQASKRRQRRIKSSLPVGLSSWLLGGIRDLDAKHWRLEPHLLDKLAVHDVRLVGVAPSAPKLSGESEGGVERRASSASS